MAVQRIVSDRIANGYAPAVMQWNANEGSRELPEMGIVLDIDEVARAEDWRRVLPATVFERITYKDKVFFAPTNVHAENWLWTSEPIFRQLGLKAPETWDEIFAAEKIKAAGHLPVALGDGPWEVSLVFNGIMYSKLGAEGYARIIRGDPALVSDPRMTESLDMLRRLSRYAEPAAARRRKTWADATAAVGGGKAGMQFMGDWAKGELVARGYSVDKDFGCSLMPGTEIAYFMVIDAFAFPLTNREDAADAQPSHAWCWIATTKWPSAVSRAPCRCAPTSIPAGSTLRPARPREDRPEQRRQRPVDGHADADVGGLDRRAGGILQRRKHVDQNCPAPPLRHRQAAVRRTKLNRLCPRRLKITNRLRWRRWEASC
ncbi:ABC-type sugar transport system, periplasmic component (plasmid) [Sinorhizobium sp. CCBAU 05631]|nr:ABC-type sugar transport system, periplasmic component [Sinorhizobium sp. CCBAU 05631]